MSLPTSGVNCVLLLGAGASKPAKYPVTDEFFGIIEERLVDESVEETLYFFTDEMRIKNLDKLYRNIHNLSSLTGDEKPAVKFLELEIDSTLAEVELTDSNRSEIEDISDTYEEFLENCNELREEFMESFHDQFSWKNELEGGYDSLARYIKILQERNNNDNHPVFTTNYDPTVEALVADDWRVNTLFEQNGNWAGEGEHILGRQTVNLFKLHGSITWIRTDRGLLEMPPKLTPEIDLNQERDLVPPGRGVGSDRQRDPYNTYWREFDNHLETAEVCIVIGHRLADKELATTLERHDTELILVNKDEDVADNAEIDDYRHHVSMKMENAHKRVEELLDRVGVGREKVK